LASQITTINIPQNLKMKRLNLFCTALFAVASFTANAQINQTPVYAGGSQISSVSGEKAMAATGTMFTNDKYMPAKLSNNDKVILLRYNAYADHFEMSNPEEQKVRSLPKMDGVTITFTNSGEVYTLQNYKTDGAESINGYLNVISDNPKIKIYKRERVYMQQGTTASNSYQTSKAPAYKRASDEFYVKVGDAEATYFDSKKDFAKLVPAKSKEVLEFIKTNKINLENAADLQKLGQYTNGIL